MAEQQTEQRQERCYVAAARVEEKSPMVPNPNPKQYQDPVYMEWGTPV